MAGRFPASHITLPLHTHTACQGVGLLRLDVVCRQGGRQRAPCGNPCADRVSRDVAHCRGLHEQPGVHRDLRMGCKPGGDRGRRGVFQQSNGAPAVERGGARGHHHQPECHWEKRVGFRELRPHGAGVASCGGVRPVPGRGRGQPGGPLGRKRRPGRRGLGRRTRACVWLRRYVHDGLSSTCVSMAVPTHLRTPPTHVQMAVSTFGI